jgi:hypothetical protein
MFVGLPSVEELERFFFLALSASFHKITRQGPCRCGRVFSQTVPSAVSK